MLRLKDNSENIFGVLKSKKCSALEYQKLFKVTIMKLLDLDNDEKAKRHFYQVFNIEDSSTQSDIENTFSDLSFSLNENFSSTMFTPYHLSFFLPFLSEKSQKEKGQITTPMIISEYMSNHLLHYGYPSSRDKKQLFFSTFADISAGTGNLLLPLIHELILINKKEHYLFTEELLSFISSNFFAIDTDQNALAIYQLRVYLTLKHFFPNEVIIPTDISIEVNDSLKFKVKAKTANNANNNTFYYDFIIGNPPFMTYGLRNGQHYSQDFKSFLRSSFLSAEYKLPLYPIFIERAIDLSKIGGKLCFIVPDSFLTGFYFKKLRQLILSTCKISRIDILNFEPFMGVTIGRAVIIVLEKVYTKNMQELNRTISNSFDAFWFEDAKKFLDFSPLVYTNSQSSFHDSYVNRFVLFFSEEEELIVSRWFELSKFTLEDIVTIHTGIRSKIGQKNIIAKEKMGETWHKGIISGKQIRPYRILYDNHWINVSPSLLWGGGYNEEVIHNPKILFRQTGDTITSAVDTDHFYHLNNCHSLKPKHRNLNLYALSVILNSEEFNKVFRILSGEKGKNLSQIDIELLLKCPIPEIDKKEEGLLEQFYHTHSTKKRFTPNLLSEILGKDILF